MKRIFVLIFMLVVIIGASYLLADNPAEIILPYALEEIEGITEVAYTEEAEPLEIAFSTEGHFFPEGVIVEIFTNNSYAEIHYTLDGSKPTTYSALYTEPLEFGGTPEMIVLRAIAVYGDEITEPITHTYFLRSDIHERFDTLVFSLSTNHDYLYCFYTGILVEGALRRDYIRENPGANIIPTSPANFNWRGREEGERPMHVEVFYPCGERVLAQNAGARVFGSWSRAENIKSIRLIARREYSPDTARFHYYFFPGTEVQDGFGTPFTRYKELILRNGGNDRNHGIVRNELGSTLARMAGFLDVTPVRAAAMFINGEYYGHMWLQTRSFEHFFQELYNTPTRDFDVIGRGEWWFRNATEEQEDALIYKNMFAWANLLDDEVFARLEAIADIDNLLWYYAFQIFVGNADWPHNNLRRWRYTGEPFAGMAPELDGRWRYAIFDLDQTFGLFGANYRRPNFQIVLEHDNESGELIRNILTRPDMAERFTMIFNDIAANVVNYEIVREVMDNLFAEISNELNHALAANLLHHWVGWYSIGNYYYRTLEFAERRHIFIFQQLGRFFDFEPDEMFSVYVNGGTATIGASQNATSSRYFAHLTIPISPVLPTHTAFDHWILNGERIYDEKIYVTAHDAVDGAVNLELVTRSDIPYLLIYSAFSDTDGNGITIINTTNRVINTSDFFISNHREELQRSPLPRANIEPGGTLELAGRSSRSPGDLFRWKLEINIRENRRIFLSDAYGNILDSFIVPVANSPS
ncbi:MAG: CotH kinase family protein [Defluviitaleaceae bacterium]|nr:CotH kinase family protein [Defluviitaleaceae bacterium]